MARLVLNSIPRSIYKGLDFHAIRKASEPALHFEIQHEIKEFEQELMSQGRIGSLMEEWRHYLEQVVVEKDKKELEALALQYLSEVNQ